MTTSGATTATCIYDFDEALAHHLADAPAMTPQRWARLRPRLEAQAVRRLQSAGGSSVRQTIDRRL